MTNFYLKNVFTSIWNYTTFISADKRTVLLGCYTYKEFKQTPTQHVEYNSGKTNLQTCQQIYKRNKDSVKKGLLLQIIS